MIGDAYSRLLHISRSNSRHESLSRSRPLSFSLGSKTQPASNEAASNEDDWEWVWEDDEVINQHCSVTRYWNEKLAQYFIKCDQVGRFLKVLGDKVTYKSRTNLGGMLKTLLFK